MSLFRDDFLVPQEGGAESIFFRAPRRVAMRLFYHAPGLDVDFLVRDSKGKKVCVLFCCCCWVFSISKHAVLSVCGLLAVPCMLCLLPLHRLLRAVSVST